MAKKANVGLQQGEHQPVANAQQTSGIMVPLEDILFTREKIVSGLLNLENGVRELRVAYVNHINTFLPDGHVSKIDPAFMFQGAAAAFDSVPLTGFLGAGIAAGAAGAGAANQKRKRKPHDPNAPKRALTSYFLFMQANKPGIKEQHPQWTAQQVSEESEKRWANISDDEKKRYEYMYNVDLARYYKQKEEYDAGRPIPSIDPAEAHALYNEHLRTGALIKGRKGRKVIETAVAAGEIAPDIVAQGVAEEPSDEEEAEDAKAEPADEDAEADDDDEEEEESEDEAPPPKAKKAKTAKSTTAKTTPKKADSPEKSKKSRGKKAADESDNSLIEDAPAKNAKKATGRKPRKSTKSD